MKRSTILLNVLCLVALLLSACDYKVVRDPNVLVRTMSADPSTLNPILATDSASSLVNNTVVERLMRRHPETREWDGVLAVSYEASADHLTYTYQLRRGVRWHDGAPFTAADVVYSFNVINDPTTAVGHLRQQYADAGISRVEAVGDHVVRFLLERPYFLAHTMISELPIVPKHIFDVETPMRKNTHNRTPIGTGPMRFDSWETGRKISLRPNPDYWGKSLAYTGIVFKIIPERRVAFQTMKKGQIDFAGLSGLEWTRQTDSAKFNRRFQKRKYLPQGVSFMYIGWNGKHPFLKDPQVRYAMTALTPRELLRDKVYFGQVNIATGPFDPNSPQSNPNIRAVKYSPYLSEKILDSRGIVDHDGDGWRDRDGEKFHITFLLSGQGRASTAIANVMRENLRKVGVSADVRTMEWSVFLKTVNDKNYDAFIGGWSGAYENDPFQIWHSSQTATGSNYISYANSEVDALLEAARIEFDTEKRNAMYHRFHEILHQEQPYTFLFNGYSLTAIHHRLQNVTVYTSGLDPRRWTVGPSNEELVQ